MGDLHPARGHLVIRERRAVDRRQPAVPVVGERRDGAAVRGGVVGVGHEQLIRVGRPELAAERAQALGRDGLSNQEIGAQLFLSTRTIEWHLRKVFTKLGVSSRGHLQQALADRGRPVATA